MASTSLVRPTAPSISHHRLTRAAGSSTSSQPTSPPPYRLGLTTRRQSFSIRASSSAGSSYADKLVNTAKSIASPGRGILAINESNSTCGKRLASIGLDNTEANRQWAIGSFCLLLLESASISLAPSSLRRHCTSLQRMGKGLLIVCERRISFQGSKLIRA